MNPRQRRGALLLVLTAVGAIVVFLAVVAFVGKVGAEVGPMTTTWEFSRDVTAYEPVEATMLREVQMPARWLPKTAIRSRSEVTGLVAATDVPAGSVLQKGMLVPRPGVQPGYREVAIVVDAETGVAGKVKPGNHVDIIATTAASDTAPQKSEIWVSNALVLEVGLPADVSSSSANGSFATTKGVPVTFALTSADALRLAYVESFSVKLRLALRGDGDDQSVPDAQRTYEGR